MCIYAKTIKWPEIILSTEKADAKEWFIIKKFAFIQLGNLRHFID